jgi:hypothetical protein
MPTDRPTKLFHDSLTILVMTNRPTFPADKRAWKDVSEYLLHLLFGFDVWVGQFFDNLSAFQRKASDRPIDFVPKSHPKLAVNT